MKNSTKKGYSSISKQAKNGRTKPKKKNKADKWVGLAPVKRIIAEFQQELKILLKNIYGMQDAEQLASSDPETTEAGFSSDQPLTANLIFTKEEEAYIWLRFEVWHPRVLMHKPTSNPLPGYYNQPALPLYQEWLEESKDITLRGCIIPAPSTDCSLINYLFQLEAEITGKCEKRTIWINSLKSFVQSIRKDLVGQNMQGPLDSIFPYRMDIRDDYRLEMTDRGFERIDCRIILKNILPTAYPIDLQLTASIIKNLVKSLMGKRPNSHKNIAEALGLAWICIAVASARLSIEEQSLFKLTTSDLIKLSSEDQSKWFEPTHFVRVPTLNDLVNVPISKWLYDYLLALPRHTTQKRLFGRYRTLSI